MRTKIVLERKHIYITISTIILVILFILVVLNEFGIIHIVGATLINFNLIVTIFFYIPLIFLGTYKLLYIEYGYIDFNDDNIEIFIKDTEKKKVDIDSKIKLRLVIDDSKRNSFWKIYIVKIHFEYDNNYLGEYKIFINKRYIERFKEVLDKYYSNKINLKEVNQLGIKAFKLKWNLSYNEIQEIKNKYGLYW